MSESEKSDYEIYFPNAENLGPRDWGEELLLVLAPGKYTMKKIKIKSGARGGLQFHRKKDEAGFVVEGRLLIRFDCGSGSLQERVVCEGEWFRFPPGLVHQEEALTDVTIIEVSTPHFNDRVRVEKDYGITGPICGLQTTEEDEIEYK